MATTNKRPNGLVIVGDDIGWQIVSAYGMGTMGYFTPNIDRIGLEGVRVADHDGQVACPAGRASSMTSPYPIRSGVTTGGVIHSYSTHVDHPTEEPRFV